MSKKTLYLLGMLLTIVIAVFLQVKFCCSGNLPKESNNTAKEVIPTSLAKTATLSPFAIKDADGDLNINVNDNFNFKESDLNILKPISEKVDEGIKKLKDYLLANKGKALSVKGYHTAGETNSSSFDNLGLARADAVKKYLAEKGIPLNVISTFGDLKDDMVPDSLGVYHGPVSFDIKGDQKSEELEKLLAYIKENPFIVNFETNKAVANLSEGQAEKASKILKYLNGVSDASCLVEGHTDSVGSDELNIRLGQKRANFGKEYLIKNSVPKNRIKTVSKGKLEPIATNETEEGRAKNRRITITIK